MVRTRTAAGKLCAAIAAAAAMAASLAAGVVHAGEPPKGVPAFLPGLPNGPMLTPGETTEETFQLNYVGIEHFESGGYNTSKGYVPKMERWEGFRGKYKLKLGILEFYGAVARPDLRAKKTTHAIIATSFLVAGLGLGIGGIYYVSKHWDQNGPSLGGLGAAGLGLTFMIVASAISTDSINEAEAYKLARAYNDRLRAHLGLQPQVEDPTVPQAALPWHRRIGLAASVAPQGGGLLIMGSF
jgi:hypothetical protein